MKAKTKLSQATLRRWLRYDPETGLFYWRERPWRAKVRVGDVAGSVETQHGKKRRILWVSGTRMYASRAAYIYVHGDIPDAALVDHANGDTLNDRIENLRLASTAQNVWNRMQREGTGYPLGVTKTHRGRFKARIQLPNGRKLNIGTWNSEEEAHAAYMGAAAILHTEFWIGSRMEQDAKSLDFTSIRRAVG